MYDKTSQTLKINGKVTAPFRTYKGVRQGCILSPRLFNMFINDLPEIFDKTCDPVKLGNIDLQCLIYADDIVILSESQKGLQRCMSKLEIYTAKWDMKLNEKKTKIISFKKQGKMSKINITFQGQCLEQVKQYKYLGTIICRNGGFNPNTKYLKGKGLRARYLVTKAVGFDGKPSTVIKIFEKMVEPILLYNCEIGQVTIPKNTDWKKFQSKMWTYSPETEKVIHGLLRLTLGVGKKTTRLGMLAEVGKYPLCMKIYIQTMKYYVRLISTDNKLLKNALMEATKRQQEGRHSWLQQIHILRKSTELDNKFELVKEPNKFMSKFKKSLYQNFEQYWKEEHKKDGKLRFYFQYKQDFKYEKYLDYTEKKQRQAISQLRLSSHKLPIEQMRIYNVNKGQRICDLCNSGEVGDEMHYLEKCSNLAMGKCRSKFKDEIEAAQPQFQKFNISNTIQYCLKVHDKETYIAFGRFVSNILKTYDNEMEKQLEEATRCPIM